MNLRWWSCIALVACALCAPACKSDNNDNNNSNGGGAGTGGTPTAVANLTGFMGGTVTGTATFTQAANGVTVVVALQNCPDGAHGVHIHQGTSCESADTQGGHWDMTRGEGIPDVMCTGGMGTSTLTRPATDPTLAWNVGGDAATNVIGHAFVVHGDMGVRIGCGIISMQ